MVGYFIEMPAEPSLYLSGDTILTDTVREFLLRHQPQVSLVPVGGVKFDLGHGIIMGITEVLEVIQMVKGTVVANHLEAFSHCPVTRMELHKAAALAGVAGQLRIPEDGEILEFSAWDPRSFIADAGHSSCAEYGHCERERASRRESLLYKARSFDPGPV